MKDRTPIPPPAERKSRRATRPAVVHPTVPGAVGSRESPYRDGRDQEEESRTLIDDAVVRIRGGRGEE